MTKNECTLQNIGNECLRINIVVHILQNGGSEGDSPGERDYVNEAVEYFKNKLR